MSADVVLTLPDDRLLAAWDSGGDGSTAVLLHLGTPSVGLPSEAMVAETQRRGMRLVTYSRPGYGESTRRPGRTVADCVPDVTALASELHIDRLHVVGWSGGGPHALACAALLPELVASAATLAGAAPLAADLDWLDGMADENREEFAAALAGPEALERFLTRTADELGAATGDSIAAALGGLVTDVDRRALAGEFAEYLAALFRGAVEHGIWGWHDDDLAFTREWGFSLDAIEVPVCVWQGREDAMVPYAHGEWLSRNVRHAPTAALRRRRASVTRHAVRRRCRRPRRGSRAVTIATSG